MHLRFTVSRRALLSSPLKNELTFNSGAYRLPWPFCATFESQVPIVDRTNGGGGGEQLVSSNSTNLPVGYHVTDYSDAPDC